MYSFILRHRHKNVVGDQPLGFTRQFLSQNTVYEMRIPSRGYLYVLDPPLPVNVLEGDIKGAQKKPIIGYVPKPGASTRPVRRRRRRTRRRPRRGAAAGVRSTSGGDD